MMENSAAMFLAFLIGGALGAALMYLLLPARRAQRALKRERDEARANLARHREEVDHHFLRTAELVNQMTASYRAVHEHLSAGARTLCSEQGRRLAMAKSLDSLPGYPGTEQDNAASISQPLDYAPSAQGTLAEDFGLRDEPEGGPFSPVDDLALAAKEDTPSQVEPPRDYAEGCEDQGCSTDEDTPASKHA